MAGLPEQIGAYLIEYEIGHGGMGDVYQATDSRLGRSFTEKPSSSFPSRTTSA